MTLRPALFSLLVSFVALLTGLPSLFTSTTADKKEPLIEPLGPLSFLVGKCWAGTFPETKVRDIHCYETAFDGTVVVDRQMVDDGRGFCSSTFFHYALPQFEGEEDGVILFRNYNPTGGVADGLIEAKGRSLEFPEEVFRDEDGREMKFKTRIRPKNEESYTVTTQQQRGRVWETRSSVLYEAISVKSYPYPEGFKACAD